MGSRAHGYYSSHQKHFFQDSRLRQLLARRLTPTFSLACSGQLRRQSTCKCFESCSQSAHLSEHAVAWHSLTLASLLPEVAVFRCLCASEPPGCKSFGLLQVMPGQDSPRPHFHYPPPPPKKKKNHTHTHKEKKKKRNPKDGPCQRELVQSLPRSIFIFGRQSKQNRGFDGRNGINPALAPEMIQGMSLGVYQIVQAWSFGVGFCMPQTSPERQKRRPERHNELVGVVFGYKNHHELELEREQGGVSQMLRTSPNPGHQSGA